MSVTHGLGSPLAHAAMYLPWTPHVPAAYPASHLCRSEAIHLSLSRSLRGTDLAHVWPTDGADGFHNLSFCTQKPVTPSGVTGSDLGFYVAGVGFEPT